MSFNRKIMALLSLAAALSPAAITSSASAATTIVDSYYGALNTYNGADVIGDTSVFDIIDATFSRTGAGGNTLHITIDTNYAGAPGTAAADGTGYGAFFITPGAHAWNPVGPAPYANDSYTPGEWAYAFTLPQDPGAQSGTAALYATGDGAVVMSNVFGDPITYPFPGNPGYFFRQGQAVQFTPNGGASPVALGNWSVDPGKITLDIVDNGALGNSFAFSWAMTCANDVIQGQVSGVPEPATWVMTMFGFGALGAMLRARRRTALQA
jgi:hypothetical protein